MSGREQSKSELERSPQSSKAEDPSNPSSSSSSSSSFSNETLKSNEYVVERILDKRTTMNGPEYLVKWLDYPESSSTWEPLTHLGRVSDMIGRFEKTLTAKQLLKMRGTKTKLQKPSQAINKHYSISHTAELRPSHLNKRSAAMIDKALRKKQDASRKKKKKEEMSMKAVDVKSDQQSPRKSQESLNYEAKQAEEKRNAKQWLKQKKKQTLNYYREHLTKEAKFIDEAEGIHSQEESNTLMINSLRAEIVQLKRRLNIAQEELKTLKEERNKRIREEKEKKEQEQIEDQFRKLLFSDRSSFDSKRFSEHKKKLKHTTQDLDIESEPNGAIILHSTQQENTGGGQSLMKPSQQSSKKHMSQYKEIIELPDCQSSPMKHSQKTPEQKEEKSGRKIETKSLDQKENK